MPLIEHKKKDSQTLASITEIAQFFLVKILFRYNGIYIICVCVGAAGITTISL